METTYLPGTLRDRILELADKHKLSQKMLAESLGLSPSTLNRFLSGETATFGHTYLIRAARMFDVSTDFLLGLTDVPDRRKFDIEELGMSAQAARNLYCGRLDKRVVSLLLENPDFAAATWQISNFISGAIAAGIAAQNKLMDCLTEMMPGPKMQEARKKVRAIKEPVYQQELSGIQANFIKAVKSMKTDMELEVQAQAMTEEQFRELLKITTKDDAGKPTGISPEAFSNHITKMATTANTFSPRTLELLNQATLSMGKDLQEDKMSRAHK